MADELRADARARADGLLAALSWPVLPEPWWRRMRATGPDAQWTEDLRIRWLRRVAELRARLDDPAEDFDGEAARVAAQLAADGIDRGALFELFGELQQALRRIDLAR